MFLHTATRCFFLPLKCATAEEECVTNVAYPHAKLYETFFLCLLSKRVLCTYEDGPPLALLLHPAVLLPRQRVRRLEHEAADVVALLKVRLLLWRFLLLEVGLDKGHLDVGKLGVKVFGVDLQASSQQAK